MQCVNRAVAHAKKGDFDYSDWVKKFNEYIFFMTADTVGVETKSVGTKTDKWGRDVERYRSFSPSISKGKRPDAYERLVKTSKWLDRLDAKAYEKAANQPNEKVSEPKEEQGISENSQDQEKSGS